MLGLPPPRNRGVLPQSGSYLGQADADGLLEEGPEDALEAGGGGEGPVVAVEEVQAWGQQVLHAEGGDGRRLPWGGGTEGDFGDVPPPTATARFPCCLPSLPPRSPA